MSKPIIPQTGVYVVACSGLMKAEWPKDCPDVIKSIVDNDNAIRHLLDGLKQAIDNLEDDSIIGPPCTMIDCAIASIRKIHVNKTILALILKDSVPSLVDGMPPVQGTVWEVDFTLQYTVHSNYADYQRVSSCRMRVRKTGYSIIG